MAASVREKPARVMRRSPLDFYDRTIFQPEGDGVKRRLAAMSVGA